MTQQQQQTARHLLRQAMDWTGLVDLSDEEAIKAGLFQQEVDDFLESLESPKPLKCDRIEDLHTLILVTRNRAERCVQERDLCRRRLDAATLAGERAPMRYLIKRYQVAYSQWEEAERVRQQAEGAYYRALTREEGP